MASASSSSVSGQVWPSLVPAGERAGKPSVELARAVVLLGSEAYNHIRMASSTVSRSHALILNSDGGSYVRDLVSRSGLFVNGEQVREKALFDGDEVKIGRFAFTFQAGVLPETEVQPPAGQLKIGNFVLPLNQRVVVIGRRAGCDLILENDLVSTVHAIIFTMNGKHVLRDLNSKNGTRVDGKKIHQVELRNADVIKVGGTEIVYTTTAARAARPAAAAATPAKPAAAPTVAPGRAAAAAALAAAEAAATAPDLDDELLPPAAAAAAAPARTADDDFDIEALLGGDGQAAADAPAGAPETLEELAPAAPVEDEPSARAASRPSDRLQVNDGDLIAVEPGAADDFAMEVLAPAPAQLPSAAAEPAPVDGEPEPAMPVGEDEPIAVEAETPLPVEDDIPAAAPQAVEVTPTELSSEVSATDDAMPPSLDDVETTETTDTVGARDADDAIAPPPLPVEETKWEDEPVVEASREDARLESLDLAPEQSDSREDFAARGEEDTVEPARERLELAAPLADVEELEEAGEEFVDEAVEPVEPAEATTPDVGAVEQPDDDAPAAVDAEELERARNTPAAEPMSAFDVEDEGPLEMPVATTRDGAAPEPVMSQQADLPDAGGVEFADTVGAADDHGGLPPETISGDAAMAGSAFGPDAGDEAEVTATAMEMAGEAETGAAPVTEEAAVTSTFDDERPATALSLDEEPSAARSLDETVTGGDAGEAPIDVEAAADAAAYAGEIETPEEALAIEPEAPTVAGDAGPLEIDGAPTSDPREAERAEDAFAFLGERPATADVSEVAARAEERRPAALLMDEGPQPLLADDEIAGRDDETMPVAEAPTPGPVDVVDVTPTDGEAVAGQPFLAAVAENAEGVDTTEPTPVPEVSEAAPGDEGAAPLERTWSFGEETPEEPATAEAPVPEPEPEREPEPEPEPAPVGGNDNAPFPRTEDAPAPRKVEEPPPTAAAPPRTMDDVGPARGPQPFFVTMSDPANAPATPPGVFFVTVAGGATVPAAPAAPAMPPRVQVVQLPLETPRAAGMPPVRPSPPPMTATRPPQNLNATAGDVRPRVDDRNVSRTNDSAPDLDTGDEIVDEDAVGLLDEPIETRTVLGGAAAEALHRAPPPQTQAPAPITEQRAPAEVADDARLEELLDATADVDDDDIQSPFDDDDDDNDAFAKRPLTEDAAARSPVVPPASDDPDAADAAAARAREASRKRLHDTISSEDSVVDVFALHADLQPPETDEAAEALETTGLPNTGVPGRQRPPGAAAGAPARPVPPTPAKWGPVAGAVAASVLDANADGAGGGRAPASPRKRNAIILVVMIIAMVLAALAIWKFVLPEVTVEATMPFARLAEIDYDAREGVEKEQHALLYDEGVHETAINLLRASEQSASPGFLADRHAMFQKLKHQWVIRDLDKKAMVVRFRGTDRVHDAARLGALVEAVYQNEKNQQRIRDSRGALRRLEQKRSLVKAAHQELADLQQKKRQFQEWGNLRPDASVLATLRQTAESLEADWNKQVNARKELQAELVRMQQSLSSSAPPPADASAAEQSDSEFARMVQELEEKKRRLEELGSGLGSKATAARRELAEAVDEFQSTIKAVQEMMKDNPALSDYVTSAQQLHEAAWKFQGDLIERQEKQQQRLVEYKRRLEEQMGRRRQEVIANDPDMKELNQMLDLKQREFSAAEQSGLKKEAAKVKADVDYVKQQIDARQRMLGQDPFYSDALAELKGIIDNVEKQLAADRERSEKTMADLETKFRLRNSEVERMPQAQRALAGKLAERATMIQQARKAYAEATAERDVDANEELKRLQSDVATLEGKVAARRKEILADLRKRTGEQQQREIERLQTRIAEAEQSEQAALEAHSKALKAFAEADALNRRWMESGGEYERLLAELPRLEKRVTRAEEDLAAEQQALKNIVTPEAPGKAQVVPGEADRRPAYAAAACAGIAVLGFSLMFLTRGGGAPGSRRRHDEGALAVTDEEVAV